MIDQLLFTISAIFALVIILAFFLHLLRQPMIIAYLLTGIIVGPLILNLVENYNDFFQTFAHLGVILLLFAVGLGLNLSYLRTIGRVAVITGIGQLVFTVTIGWLLLTLLDFSAVSALYLAIALTFSSTIIIIKLLSEKSDTQSVYGRHVIGLLLVQDLIAIMLLMFLPLFSHLGPDLGARFFQLALKVVLVGVSLALVTRFALPPLLKKIGTSGEFLFVFTVAWCLGVASIMRWVGFPWEIGAVLAGIPLSSSTHHYEIVSRIKPLRDFFIILFFIILGSQISLTGLQTVLWPGIILSAFILIGNPLILFWLYRWLGFTRRNSFLIGLTAAQVSEFGFILLFMGETLKAVSQREVAIFTFVALTTICVSSYLILYNDKLYRLCKPRADRLLGRDAQVELREKPLNYPIWIFGYHRMGWKVCQNLLRAKLNFGVVDYSVSAIEKLRARHLPAFFGDASDVDFLAELPLHKARLIISTIPEYNDQITLLEYLKKVNPKATIICNLYHTKHLHDLYAAGADYIVLPHLLGGEFLGQILNKKTLSKRYLNQLKLEQAAELTLEPVTQYRVITD
ncbi:cation:proton antiporter [Candidatus Falkowbacteria bacterium]|nr:cation:proton antiporter [Candidatus Falkowbacteria bacterium]